MIGEATMTAATKTPMITPVYADEAVEARHQVRTGAKGGGAGWSAFHYILTPAFAGVHSGLQHLHSDNVHLKILWMYVCVWDVWAVTTDSLRTVR